MTTRTGAPEAGRAPWHRPRGPSRAPPSGPARRARAGAVHARHRGPWRSRTARLSRRARERRTTARTAAPPRRPARGRRGSVAPRGRVRRLPRRAHRPPPQGLPRSGSPPAATPHPRRLRSSRAERWKRPHPRAAARPWSRPPPALQSAFEFELLQCLPERGSGDAEPGGELPLVGEDLPHRKVRVECLTEHGLQVPVLRLRYRFQLRGPHPCPPQSPSGFSATLFIKGSCLNVATIGRHTPLVKTNP